MGSASAGWWLLPLLVASWWVLMACASPVARLLAGLVELLGAALAAAWCCGVWPFQRPHHACPVLDLLLLLAAMASRWLLAGWVELLWSVALAVAALAAAWCCGAWPWQRPRRACPVLELPARGSRHWHSSGRGAALCLWAAARRGAQGPGRSRPRAWRCTRLRARQCLHHAVALLLVVALLLAELRTTELAVWSEVHRLESPLWGEQQTTASLGLLLTSLCSGAASSLHSGAWPLCIAMLCGACVLGLLLAFAAALRRIAASPCLLLLFLLAECCSEAREGSLLPALQVWGALAMGCAALWMHRLVGTRGWGLWCRAAWGRSVHSWTASRSHPADAEIVGGHGCADCCEQGSEDGHDGHDGQRRCEL